MAIYSTLVNKVAAFRLYFNKSLSNLDLNNSSNKDFSTCNTAPKPNIIEARISGALAVYTKV